MTTMTRQIDRRRFISGSACSLAVPAAFRVRETRAASLRQVDAPATHAGRRLAWLLETINANKTPSQSALARVFTADFLTALPAPYLASLFPSYFNPGGPMALARFEGPTDRPAL